MTKCARCGSETQLVVSGIPMCPKCQDESEGESIAKGDRKHDWSGETGSYLNSVGQKAHPTERQHGMRARSL
jgi:hypothetical protein